MAYETRLSKNFSPIERRSIGLGVLAGLLISLTYLSPSIFYSFPFSNENIRSSSMNTAPTSQLTNDSVINSPKLGLENVTHESLEKCNGSSSRLGLCENGDAIMTNVNQSANASVVGNGDANSTQLLLGKLIESKDGNMTIEEPTTDKLKMNSDVKVSTSATAIHKNSTQEQATINSIQLSGNSSDSIEEGAILDALKFAQLQTEGDASLSKNSSSSSKSIYSTPKEITSKPIDSTLKEVTNNSILQSAAKIDVKPMDIKPLCDFSNRRSNLCDMYGDIRIHGKSSSVVYVTSSQDTQRNESWRIKPYARKTDLTAMAGVREITVRSSNSYEDSPQCSVTHNVPAIIFSVAGYTGNYFHDFTDVLVPLFLTSYQFNGEVQFLIANFRWWWINKYRPIFSGLSKYEFIDFDNDDRVHCSRHVMLGLNSHDDLRIDTWRSPNGYSMVDFTKFLKTAYSLPRDSPLTIGVQPQKKPRLLILARSRTRRFTNLSQIVKMAQKLGFEVVVGEAEHNVTHYAQIVNSCDVLMGVHGAGLTNLMFLPTNAILIQIVPWGELDWIAKNYFREPAKGMRLRYLEYKIQLDESTLTELYSRDDPVLKDPLTSVHKYGWNHLAEIYLMKQNVKLNVKRFRPVLLKALKLLHEQKQAKK